MEYRIIEQLTPKQAVQLHAMYQEEWWTRGRSLESVQKMLANTSFVFGLVPSDSDQLIGFARVVTDCVFKALILDLIVHPDFRKKGLGEFLMKRIHEHPSLKNVKHLELYCLPELVPFYEKLGFVSDVGGVVLMRRL